ncbi:hypothetical protein Q0M94_11760 [Deinococcus radiomollis]|uniref:hypothetical protein n=1 Tax=Deinococcus radiomollis TaxID=468916 RepID=UPI00389181D4
MTVLLGDGLVQQRYNAAGRTELILPDPALSPGAVLEGPISVKAAEVLGRLLLNAEGISSLAKALNFSPAVTLESVEELERLGRVARRQVGMLVIYRVATLSTVG